MKWQEYYDRFWDWADSTRLRHIPSLTNFSSSAEVTEIAVDSCEDAIAMALVKRAISCGIRFTPEEVIELACYMDEETLATLIQSRNARFSEEQYRELDCLCYDEKLLKRVAKEDGHRFRADPDFRSGEIQIVQYINRDSSSLFKRSEKKKQQRREHKGRCDGDCANCPDHYGYRYGRWYYGHHHSHGCEFGGNDNSGGW